MKVTLVHTNIEAALYLGEHREIKDYCLETSEVLKALVGKGGVLDYQEVFIDTDDDLPKTLTELMENKL